MHACNTNDPGAYQRMHDMVSLLGNRPHPYWKDGETGRTRAKDWYFALDPSRLDKKPVPRGAVVVKTVPMPDGRIYLPEWRIEVPCELVRDSLAYRLLFRALSMCPIDTDYVQPLLDDPRLKS